MVVGVLVAQRVGDGGPVGADVRHGRGGVEAQAVDRSPSPSPMPVAAGAAGPASSAPPAPFAGWVDPASVGQPYGDTVQGLLTFRGNPTRTYHGAGPVPTAPQIAWRYPESGGLCGPSTVGSETTQWCGTGWTGQPAVFERDGRTWLIVGAYDHHVHFLDAATGAAVLPPFPTGDLIKGSVTVDPDGFPLVYVGSRDGAYRVVAFDGPQARELWRLEASAVGPTLWNDDWDSSGLVLDDHLFVGGENSRWHVARLNRGYDAAGSVVAAPELVFDAAGWDDELLADLGDRNVSIESSLAVSGDTVYFANSGGLVQGWDIGDLAAGGEPQRVFRYWTGDDTDATVVVDEQGALYVASEWERENARAREVGQVLKLDPARPDDPLVWSHALQAATPDGVWGTPAVHRDVVIVPTDTGAVLALDRASGAVRWTLQLEGPTWQSPVVVDDVLIQGDCGGVLRAFDVSQTVAPPPLLWELEIGGCIESTPAVWNGGIYVGTRAGAIVGITDRPS